VSQSVSPLVLTLVAVEDVINDQSRNALLTRARLGRGRARKTADDLTSDQAAAGGLGAVFKWAPPGALPVKRCRRRDDRRFAVYEEDVQTKDWKVKSSAGNRHSEAGL
jgi:hypothetical protein